MPPVSPVVAYALREFAADEQVPLRVSGACMAPLVKSGSVVTFVRRRWYWPGDPVVVHSPDGLLLVHRLLGTYRGRSGWRCVTQGDNAPSPDTALPWSSVVGRVGGGDCHALITRVPLRHRLVACGRFLRHALRAVIRRS